MSIKLKKYLGQKYVSEGYHPGIKGMKRRHSRKNFTSTIFLDFLSLLQNKTDFSTFYKIEYLWHT